MFLSFIVPIYNIATYLEQCIDSLINQDFDDYEIILVDDGSTDSSGEVCDKYAQNFDKVKVVHKPNGGPSSARNVGIIKASGEYLAFVDGDDYLETNCLKSIKLSIDFQNNPQVVFLQAYKVFPNGRRELLDEEYDSGKILNQKRSAVQMYLATLNKYPGSACTKIIKKAFVQKNNLRFENGSLCEDLEFVMNMLLTADSFGYYTGNYYYYRQKREGSTTNLVSYKNYCDRMRIFDNWREIASKSTDTSEQILLNSARAYEYKIMLADAGKLQKTDIKRAFSWLRANINVLQFRDDKQIKLIRAFVYIFGVKLTSRFLQIFLYLKD